MAMASITTKADTDNLSITVLQDGQLQKKTRGNVFAVKHRRGFTA